MARLDAVLAYAASQQHWFVYAIRDEWGRVAYIGATQHPERRYRQHCEAVATGRLGRWQRPLRAWIAGNRHTFAILQTYPTKRAMLDAERAHIIAMCPQFNALPSRTIA